MFKVVDNFLNSITMYRLVVYVLLVLTVLAIVLAIFNILPFSPLQLIISALLLAAVCYLANVGLAKLFKTATNVESALITALILFFIMTPAGNFASTGALTLAATLATASKYLLAIRCKHIFNPAAVGAVLVGLTGLGGSSWWISELAMLPLVALLGFLVVRKIRRWHMSWPFFVASLTAMIVVGAMTGGLAKIGLINLLSQALTTWPLVFFGTIMLTEPLTTPPTRKLRVAYGVLVGLFFGSPFHVGHFFFTSELALVTGNLFSFAVSFKQRLFLVLKEQKQLAQTIFEFIFKPNGRFNFRPGQYLEWTLPHPQPDGRGNRRYFTIASSPTEDNVHLAVKSIDRSSSFKKTLVNLKTGGTLIAGQLAGDFTLPTDPEEKLVFIAGGIGITPFRSMIKYLFDTQQKREVVLFYAAVDAAEFVYQDIFKAAEKIGLKVIYVLTNTQKIPANWPGKVGFINKDMIKSEVGDYKERIYYLSGPQAMVSSYKHLLKSLGINHRQIKTDYFPGY